jgi:hypothetical protein
VDFPAALSNKAIEDYRNPHWRLRNLYFVKDENGARVPFRPNWVQEDFLDEMWYLNLIPKARQLGMTTIITLFMLDACIWNPGVKAATIADTEPKAKEIFDEKVKFAYDNLPDWIKHGRTVEKDNAHGIEFDNDSSYIVGVSVRGLTVQYLHVSELGKIAATAPEKAKEIRTGALNTVHAGNFIFIESTAMGQAGLFWELVDAADKAKAEGKPLTKLSYKLHFYPWYVDARYSLSDEDAEHVVITDDDVAYFQKLEAELDIELTRGQRAWYVKKREVQKGEMKQEYPATLKEAFEQSIDGAYLSLQMTKVRLEGRIMRLPWVAGIPVNTFFDLGHSDYTSMWLHQRVDVWNHFLLFYQNSGEQIGHYIAWLQRALQERAMVMGGVYLPHDAVTKHVNAAKSTEELVREALAGIQVHVVERPNNKYFDGIEASRRSLSSVRIDPVGCADGIKCLDHYRKKWNPTLGCFRDEPEHDEFSHGYDAFEQFARGFVPGSGKSVKRGKAASTNYRTV